ncbi:MAG: MerR family transcriptional regulator [Deltaproteobacteria bacterium]|nr:MerR family transcriptional regulator [Deltaproteobacteria bacterium]
MLRFCKSEFPQIKPVRSGTQQRLYRRQDLDTFLIIKNLLYTEQYTISGAKKYLSQPISKSPSPPVSWEKTLLSQIKHGLIEIKNMLEETRPTKKRERVPANQARLPFDED